MAGLRSFLRDHGHVVLAVSLVLLTGLLAANVLVLSDARRSGVGFGPSGATNSTIVVIGEVAAETGDIVSTPHLGWAYALADVVPIGRLDFYVVEGGEGTKFLAGARPEHVYAEHIGIELRHPCHIAPDDALPYEPGKITVCRAIERPDGVSIVRPEPPDTTGFDRCLTVKDGRCQPDPAAPPARVGVDRCPIMTSGDAFWREALCLDLVWVYHETPASGDASTLANMTEGEKDLVAALASSTTLSPVGGFAWSVSPGWTVRAQWGFYVAQAVAIAGILSGGLGSLLSRSPGRDPVAAGDETAALVHLVDRGGQVLRRLRNLVAIGGFLLLPFGFLAWRGITDAGALWIGPLGPAGWHTWITWASTGVLALLLGLWLLAWAQLHRSVRRWRATSARPPLGP